MTNPRENPHYEQLDRTRSLIRNAELSPLPDEADQTFVLAALVKVRDIYRAAWDKQEGRK